MLHRGERVPIAEPDGEGVGKSRRLPGAERPRSPLLVHERGSRGWDIRNRSEVGVDPEVPQGCARLPTLPACPLARAQLAHPRWREPRRYPRDPLDRPALLVDGDQEPRLAAVSRRAPQLGRDRAQSRSRAEVVAEEDDAAHLSPAHASEQGLRRPSAVHSDDELLADHLLQRRRWGNLRRRGRQVPGVTSVVIAAAASPVARGGVASMSARMERSPRRRSHPSRRRRSRQRRMRRSAPWSCFRSSGTGTRGTRPPHSTLQPTTGDAEACADLEVVPGL